jgi:hypothetical protein
LDVRKGTILFGAGVGGVGDIPNMVEFMKALTGSQLRGPKGGVAPPSCGIGSWGGQCLSMGDYVTGTGPTDGVTAPPKGASVGYPQ